jgi:hypothetical protein
MLELYRPAGCSCTAVAAPIEPADQENKHTRGSFASSSKPEGPSTQFAGGGLPPRWRRSLELRPRSTAFVALASPWRCAERFPRAGLHETEETANRDLEEEDAAIRFVHGGSLRCRSSGTGARRLPARLGTASAPRRQGRQR